MSGAPPPAPPAVRRRLVDTRLGQLHVRLAGPGSAAPGAALDAGGTPLVLLHMSPLSGRMFDAVLPELSARRLVLLPDRIGFGQSDRLAAPVRLEAYAAATLDALDALDVAEFDVVGIHTGSCEAVELAARTAPARVRRAGVVAVPVLTPQEAADFKAHYAPPPTPLADGSHLAQYWEWWRQAGIWWEGQARPAWSPELRFARVREHLLAGPDVWWTYHAVFDYPLAERIAEVRQPLLVLAPHDDLWTQTERALPLLPPQARVVELPHGDSEVFALCAGEVARHIEELLA